MEAPGKLWLKVCGILLIILGGFTLMGAFLYLMFSTLMASQPDFFVASVEDGYEMWQSMGMDFGLSVEEILSMGGVFLQAGIWALIQGLIELPMGIVGVKFSKRVDKANICVGFAVLFITFELVRALVDAFSGNFGLYGTLFAMVLPVLYLVGAMKNKQATQN